MDDGLYREEVEMELKRRPEVLSCWWLRRFVAGCLGAVAVAPLLTGGAHSAPSPQKTVIAPTADALKNRIIINAPIIIPYPTAPARERVRVQFVAQGDDWGAVYLDDRLLYQPTNFNRRQEFRIDQGGYRLVITGVSRFDVWASGYLDVGRDDASVLVVTFSKNGGVSVAGDPYAWIPDVP